MNMKYLIGALVVVAFLSGGVGCSQTREIGKSSKQLFRGEVGAVVQQPPAQVAQAVEAAIADLHLIRIGATTRPTAREETETVVTARNSADAKVWVAFRATKPEGTQTRIAVSTGVMGNSTMRDQLWDAVRIRLGMLNLANGASAPVAANPTTPATQPVTSAAE